MWRPSGWPHTPSRPFSHQHLFVAAQTGLECVCVFGHDGISAVLARRCGQASNSKRSKHPGLQYNSGLGINRIRGMMGETSDMATMLNLVSDPWILVLRHSRRDTIRPDRDLLGSMSSGRSFAAVEWVQLLRAAALPFFDREVMPGLADLGDVTITV